MRCISLLKEIDIAISSTFTSDFLSQIGRVRSDSLEKFPPRIENPRNTYSAIYRDFGGRGLIHVLRTRYLFVIDTTREARRRVSSSPRDWAWCNVAKAIIAKYIARARVHLAI